MQIFFKYTNENLEATLDVYTTLITGLMLEMPICNSCTTRFKDELFKFLIVTFDKNVCSQKAGGKNVKSSKTYNSLIYI